MGDKRKLQKRVFVSEEDISTLLQRYTAMTVLTVLQEVAQVQDVEIDWNDLVRKTNSGITNAREYQMLWRHLAYRHGFLDNFDDAAQPMDDDSDLEYELEAFPPINTEASAEAAAYVKVLIASGVPCDSKMMDDNTIEAPLTISIPNGQTSRPAPDNSLHGVPVYGTKITVPVILEKQPVPSVTAAEGLENTNVTANANYPPRRKRKPWSDAEDMELIAAVQKYGEGNWANILKGDFKGDRTAPQLSQRWSTIRKRHGSGVVDGSQLSEAQLAARHAMSLALGDNRKASCPSSTNARPNSSGAPSNSLHLSAANKASGGPKSEHQQDLVPSIPRVIPKNPSPKPGISQVSVANAAAVAAAGPRIATTPSGAASLHKMVPQSKKVVQITHGGTPAVKSSLPSSTNGLPSNVHFIRTGLVTRPAGPSNASLRPASPAIQPNSVAAPSRRNVSSGIPGAPASSPMTLLEVKTKAATIQKNQNAVLTNAQSKKFEVNRAASVGNTSRQVQEDQIFGSGNLLTEKVEGQASILGDAVKEPEGENKASRIRVQEKLIPSLQTISPNSIGNQGEKSNKDGNRKTDLTVERESKME